MIKRVCVIGMILAFGTATAFKAPAHKPAKRAVPAKTAQVQVQRTYQWDSRFYIHYQDTGPDAMPALDTATLTMAGFTRGADGVPDYVQWVAHALSYSFHYITDTLHYVYPVTHVGIRMLNLGFYYGLTYSSDSIDLDNDLGWINPMEVNIRERYETTVAHEFFHMVQFTMLASLPSYMNFFSEPSATWVEDKIYPAVNDYIQFMMWPPNILTDPGRSLDSANTDIFYDNSDRAVWPMFLDQRYSPDVIRFAWENYAAGDTNTATVFDSALSRFQPGTTFQVAFMEFGTWLFYTGARTPLHETFEDAALYPEVRVDTVNGPFNELATMAPRSLRYFYLENITENDKIVVRIAGTESCTIGVYVPNIENDSLLNDTMLLVSKENEARLWTLAANGGYVCLFNAGDTLVDISIGDTSVVIEKAKNLKPMLYVSATPNPANDVVEIGMAGTTGGECAVSIYGLSGNLVKTIKGNGPFMWNAEKVPAGVYIIRVSSGSETYCKKVVIQR